MSHMSHSDNVYGVTYLSVQHRKETALTNKAMRKRERGGREEGKEGGSEGERERR